MLTMLHQARYGTEIINMVWDASKGRIDINFGSLYPTLNRLVKRGFIIETVDVPHSEGDLHDRGGHRRKYHMLTEYGRTALREVYQCRSVLRDMKGQWQHCI